MIFLLCFLLILPPSPLYVAGISLIGFAMLMILYLTFDMRFRPISEKEALDSQSFLTDHIEKLQKRKRVTSNFMWIYTFLLVLGINIGYIDVLKPPEPAFRILAHAVVTIFVPLGNYFAIKKRMKRQKEEVDPLIAQLEQLKQKS